MGRKAKKYNTWVVRITTGVLLLLMIFLVLFVLLYGRNIDAPVDSTVYDRYYVMISDDADSTLHRSVCEACRAAAAEQGAYLEMMSDQLPGGYTAAELLEIAIDSDVDGIVLSANGGPEIQTLVNRTAEKGIPIITVLTDFPDSERVSFVGVGNYNLGKEYGQLIIKLASQEKYRGKPFSAVVLMDAGAETSGQNVLFSALKTTVEEEAVSREAPIEISMSAVDSTNSFSVEESVRALFMEKRNSLPDVIVCLNENDTTGVYQTVVEFNEVGRVNILGSYDSEPILKGIERGVIYATIAADTGRLGAFCIQALTDYYEFGNTSQYYTGDITLITAANAADYRKEDADEE